MRFFQKELPDQPFRLSNGLTVVGEFLAFDQPSILAEVDAAIAKQTGGLVEITKEQYEDGLKKKEHPEPPRLNSRQLNQVFQSSRPQNGRSAAGNSITPARAQRGNPDPVVAAQQEAAPPLTIPAFTPKVGKLS